MHVVAVVLGIQTTVEKRNQIVATLNNDPIAAIGAAEQSGGFPRQFKRGQGLTVVVDVQHLYGISVSIEQR